MAPRKLIKITFPIILLVGLYFVGPSADRAEYDTAMPEVPESAAPLVQYVQAQEQKHNLKTDNEARIVWFDSSRTKTPYSIVYLHGFSASQKEGDPVHVRTAKAFGCNLYLSRL